MRWWNWCSSLHRLRYLALLPPVGLQLRGAPGVERLPGCPARDRDAGPAAGHVRHERVPLLFGIATAGNVISMGLFVWALVQLFQERSAVSVLFRSWVPSRSATSLLGVAVVLGVVALIIAQNEFGLF